MRIRNKILIYFSSTVIVLSAITVVIIYLLFSSYREEEFQQRQKVKIKHTISLLSEYQEMSENLAEIMDKQTIHDFFDEKMLVFDSHKDLVYASLDNLVINSAQSILQTLSPAHQWVETKEGDYDVIGLYTENGNTSYYAISKAYDDFGYSKLYFLRNVLVIIFLATALIVILISFYLSRNIAQPITALAENLIEYKPGSGKGKTLPEDTSSYELQYLTSRFNDLLKRTDEAFDFQKNAIHHISHELKTPVAVLVSELEKARTLNDSEEIKQLLEQQVAKAKSLGTIINVLLEISKIESGRAIQKQAVRADEILFDLIGEFKGIYPEFHFEVNYFPDEIDESCLVIDANPMLIKQAFSNLLSNCVAYSSESRAAIRILCPAGAGLRIEFLSRGPTIAAGQQRFLFDPFFRGKNSSEKSGFGLGLPLAKRIVSLHGGAISYHSPQDGLNVFTIQFNGVDE